MAATTRTPEGLSTRLYRAATGMVGLRVGLVIAQAWMVLQTWRLWNARTIPPNLPAWSWLPQFSVGWIILASLVLALARPRVGLVVQAVVLVAALAMDQMRLQPEFVSVAILLVATGPWRLAPTLGRAHLASLWIWAGLAKATSTGFDAAVGRDVAHNLHISGLHTWVSWGIPLVEVALGVFAIIPLTRRWAGLAGFVFHIGTIVGLDMQLSWAILPWNLALAWASLHLFYLAPAPDTSREGRWRLFNADKQRTALLLVVFCYPMLVYVGLLSLYLGHHVYSGDGSYAQVCEADGRCGTFGIDVSGAAVGAIIPQEQGVLEQWFELQCKPGETLKVYGRAFRPPLDHAYGTGTATISCPTS